MTATVIQLIACSVVMTILSRRHHCQASIALTFFRQGSIAIQSCHLKSRPGWLLQNPTMSFLTVIKRKDGWLLAVVWGGRQNITTLCAAANFTSSKVYWDKWPSTWWSLISIYLRACEIKKSTRNHVLKNMVEEPFCETVKNFWSIHPF